ncbi:MAG: hypothetical protein RRA94_10255 [Bacteroidota bacterium]|nr:hypothetical protein [Bacteroidota bacterium]
MTLPRLLSFLFLPVLFIACQQRAQTEKAPSPNSETAFIDVTPEVASLLRRAEKTLAGLSDVRYSVLYSFKAGNAKDTTHNVFTVLLRRAPGDALGYKVFARNFGNYHVLYDGSEAFAGDPSSKKMTRIGAEHNPADWVRKSFVGKAIIGRHHGSAIPAKIRESKNILSLHVEDTEWEGAPAHLLRMTFGAKAPVTGGTLDIVFRGSDALPVSVRETLQLGIDDRVQTQFMSTSYIEVDLAPDFPDGQFDRVALPEAVTFE